MKSINEAMKKLTESKKLIKEGYTAREDYEAKVKRYIEHGGSEDNIKILAETDLFILAGYKGTQNNGIHLDVFSSNYRYVSVYIDQEFDVAKVNSAKINWSSIGSVEAEEAEEFAKYLNDAIKFVKEIDGKDYSSEFNK